MKSGLFKYENFGKKFNLGDYIQSLAAKQFILGEHSLVYRDELNSITEPTQVICNGWFTHKPENWPPNNFLKPLFISFHLNSTAHKILDKENVIAYFKKHSPIGCRDYATLHALKSKGIDCFYSGCLTLTLGESFKRPKKNNGKIYFVDVLFNFNHREIIFESWKNFLKHGIIDLKLFKINLHQKTLKKLFDKSILKKAEFLTHLKCPSLSQTERFSLAETYLNKYKSAKLVVTSRIHVALPCLAMGTPVIFINGGFDHQMDKSRFDGIVDLMNKIDLDNSGTVLHSNFNVSFPISEKSIIQNPKLNVKIKKDLISAVKGFMKK